MQEYRSDKIELALQTRCLTIATSYYCYFHLRTFYHDFAKRLTKNSRFICELNNRDSCNAKFKFKSNLVYIYLDSELYSRKGEHVKFWL